MVDDSLDFSAIAAERPDTLFQFLTVGTADLSTVLTPCSDRYHGCQRIWKAACGGKGLPFAPRLWGGGKKAFQIELGNHQ